MFRTVAGAVLVVAVLIVCEGEFLASASQFRAAKEGFDLEQLHRSLQAIEASRISRALAGVCKDSDAIEGVDQRFL
jgi:hypothetical protein